MYMAYIHVKRIGKRKYYTLRISVREKGKVITKDLCNLGSDASKIKIETLEKKYNKEIKKSYRTIKKFIDKNHYRDKIKKVKKSKYFSKEQLINIEAVKLHYNKDFMKRETQEPSWESFIINFAVNSTSIEGNTINLKEGNLLLREGILPKKTLNEVNDLVNTKKVINYLKEEKPRFNLNLIIKIHDMLLKDIDIRKGIRNHDIHIFGQPFKPTDYRYIKADMKLLIDWYKKQKIYPLAAAIFFHHKFENIHPFSDGNGRTGRIIMNYLLSLERYPPLVISRKNRKKYLETMNQADKALKKGLTNIDSSYRALLDFVFLQYKRSYWDTFL